MFRGNKASFFSEIPMKSINTRALCGKNDYNINFKTQLFQR